MDGAPMDEERRAQLLELLLRERAARRGRDGGDGSDRAEGSEVELEPQEREELLRLEAFLERFEVLADAGEAGGLGSSGFEAGEAKGSPSDAQLVERILSRTTREDLSWRGDLALYGRHLRSRLASSLWLRLAAASLLLHLIALPALAYYIWVGSPRRPKVTFVPYEQYYPEGFPEEVREKSDDPLGVPGEEGEIPGPLELLPEERVSPGNGRDGADQPGLKEADGEESRRGDH